MTEDLSFHRSRAACPCARIRCHPLKQSRYLGMPQTRRRSYVAFSITRNVVLGLLGVSAAGCGADGGSASGTQDDDVTASTAGSLPGAFDREGNLWVIDSSSGVGLKRYPAATLAAGGTETPDLSIGSDALSGGVPGPISLAFDKVGNLWV